MNTVLQKFAVVGSFTALLLANWELLFLLRSLLANFLNFDKLEGQP